MPYGRPLPANRYFICHDDGGHCPAGVVGRIHTAGVNLALGYLEQGELKQHDFVTLEGPDGQPLGALSAPAIRVITVRTATSCSPPG